MLGFVVTPTTCLSRISSARLPVTSRSLDMSSSQIETPAADSSPSLEFVMSLPLLCLARPASGVRHCLRGEAQLTEQRLVAGGRAEVPQQHDPPGPADQPVPRLRAARLDGH